MTFDAVSPEAGWGAHLQRVDGRRKEPRQVVAQDEIASYYLIGFGGSKEADMLMVLLMDREPDLT